MQDYAIVTGGGTGIGLAIARALAERGLQVLICGRREAPLREASQRYGAGLQPVVADVATEAGRGALRQALPAQARLRALVHNAALLEPVCALADMDPAAWRRHYAVNVEAPLFLTRELLPVLDGGGRVLHISSGAAHHAYPGWAAYCSSKAALHMLFLAWKSEWPVERIAFGSLRPGVVNTPMQAHIRGIPAQRFPAVERFQRLHAEGGLREPAEVGGFAAWLLMEQGAAAYSAQEWDLGDPGHRRQWERQGERPRPG
ncbi:SDR family NAD(P)-dependent oxidoreductase [Alkalilimnicola sp. S0819]|uniref:SDR family NAD(P)-dependent oxidoreductase n=1 Tax=Alkalilimnicola sp. S0819 TaxID=2613922 RepID=UPI00126260CD|nr:SDR family NAD(P)-dependent oxidoreductase [Alkalilimnicola sp. S0819]KAB7627585.1 SDR family NAD(P)-dependent oxidoreductase [Alkalilimnicola sp. S0819]MPQ15746.1 SDR family NAD(P)-dependent oxidoreductase [Alkalilimnicola sp. S0819]